MRRFQFRLERLLRLRRQQARLAEGRLAAARQGHAAAVRGLQAAAALLAERCRLGAARERGGVPAAEFVQWRRHVAGLRLAVDQAAGAVDRAAAGLERCRQELVAARRRERILERLRELQGERHRAALSAAAQAAADAAVLARFGRS